MEYNFKQQARVKEVSLIHHISIIPEDTPLWQSSQQFILNQIAEDKVNKDYLPKPNLTVAYSPTYINFNAIFNYGISYGESLIADFSQLPFTNLFIPFQIQLNNIQLKSYDDGTGNLLLVSELTDKNILNEINRINHFFKQNGATWPFANHYIPFICFGSLLSLVEPFTVKLPSTLVLDYHVMKFSLFGESL